MGGGGKNWDKKDLSGMCGAKNVYSSVSCGMSTMLQMWDVYSVCGMYNKAGCVGC